MTRRPRLLALVLSVTATLGLGAGGPVALAPEHGRAPATKARLFVTSSGAGSLSVIDIKVTAGKIAADVAQTLPISGRPLGVAAHGGEGTRGVGEILLVTRSTRKSVLRIDPSTLATTATIKVGRKPSAVVIAPDGKLAYVLSPGSKDIRAIDLNTNQVVGKAAVGRKATDLAINADGTLLAVAEKKGIRLLSTNPLARARNELVRTAETPPSVAFQRSVASGRDVVWTGTSEGLLSLDTDTLLMGPLPTGDGASLVDVTPTCDVAAGVGCGFGWVVTPEATRSAKLDHPALAWLQGGRRTDVFYDDVHEFPICWMEAILTFGTSGIREVALAAKPRALLGAILDREGAADLYRLSLIDPNRGRVVRTATVDLPDGDGPHRSATLIEP